MAYFDSAISEYAATGTTYQMVGMPDHSAGTLLLAVVAQDGAVGVTTATSGWAQIGSGDLANTLGQQLFWKLAASSSEAPPLFENFSSGQERKVTIAAYRDVDQTTPIDASPVYASSTVDDLPPIDWTGITTATDNALIVHILSTRNNSVNPFAPNNELIYDHASETDYINTSLFHGVAVTTGAYPAKSVKGRSIESYRTRKTTTIAIRSSVASTDIIPSAVVEQIKQFYGRVDLIETITTENPYTYITSVDGAPVWNSDAYSGVSNTYLSTNGNTSGTNDLIGTMVTLDSTLDLTDSFFGILTTYFQVTRVGSLGSYVGFWDSSNNYKVYNLGPSARLAEEPTPFYNFIDVENETGDAESGTLDVTDITKVLFLVHTNNALSMGMYVNYIMKCSGANALTGGSQNGPIDSVRITRAVNNMQLFNTAIERQGLGQCLIRAPLAIGDGATKTYVNFQATAVEWALYYNPSKGRYETRGSGISLTLNASADDTFDMRNCLMTAQPELDAVLNLLGSADAMWRFNGMVLGGLHVNGGTGFSYTALSVGECYDFYGEDGTFTNCTFSDGLGSHHLHLIDGASVTGCDFSGDTSTGYHISFDGTGTLNIGGTSFADASTADIEVTAVTGTVTIVLASGQATPTYTTAGATVVITSTPVSYVAQYMADDTRYQLSHQQVFDVASADINTSTEEITLGNDSNGDAPAFDVSTAGEYTTIRVNLAEGATIPTTVPQIIDSGIYRARTESSGVITLSLTEGGTTITFTDDGTDNGSGELMTLVCESNIARGVVSGGSGLSVELSLSDGARVRRRAMHYDETSGYTVTSIFFDDVANWSIAGGIADSAEVDNAINPWTVINRIASIDSIQLGEEVKNVNGVVISSITPEDKGSDVTGLGFALEGAGRIQINAADGDGFIPAHDLVLWGAYVMSTEQGMWLSSENTLETDDLYNATVHDLEIDETSGTFTKVVGMYIAGVRVAEASTGSVALNVATRGYGALVFVDGAPAITGDIADIPGILGVVEANIKYVNDVQVAGTGSDGDTWGPA